MCRGIENPIGNVHDATKLNGFSAWHRDLRTTNVQSMFTDLETLACLQWRTWPFARKMHIAACLEPRKSLGSTWESHHSLIPAAHQGTYLNHIHIFVRIERRPFELGCGRILTQRQHKSGYQAWHALHETVQTDKPSLCQDQVSHWLLCFPLACTFSL